MMGMDKKRLKILQIEDNPGDVRLVFEMLKDIRMFDSDADVAQTLEEGLNKLQANRYDVVLLDLGLSESFGIETLHQVLSAPFEIPVVIVMTIMDDEQTGIQAVKEGAQDYLIKGELTPHLLSRSIQYALERHEAKRKLETRIEQRTAELRRTMESLKVEIEERKRTEVALIAAKEEAEQASKAKSEFFSIINHELRTPMNGILGFSQILLETAQNKEQEEYIRTIILSAHNLSTIISEILDMVQIKTEPYTMEPVKTAIEEFYHQILEETGKMNLRQLPVIGNLSEKCPRFILMDDEKIKKALMHLLSNAIKFTDEGSIEFAIDVLKLSREPREVQLQFLVRDTGIGIKPEDKERIFNAFRQVDMSSTRLHGGVGMGLCIARSIVEKADSQLEFYSKYGEGSAFWFTLILHYL